MPERKVVVCICIILCYLMLFWNFSTHKQKLLVRVNDSLKLKTEEDVPDEIVAASQPPDTTNFPTSTEEFRSATEVYKTKNIEPETAMPTNSSCELKMVSSDNVTGRESVITTDPKKFLLPVLYNGPTNQLIGLQEALLYSIKLNRTLILPVFKKHGTDSTAGTKLVPIGLRVDLESLADFVSIQPHSKLNNLCNNQISLMFSSKQCSWLYKKRIRLIQNAFKYVNFSFPKNQQGNPDFLCVNENNTNQNIFDKVLKSNATCVVHGFYETGYERSWNLVPGAREQVQLHKKEKTKPKVASLSDRLIFSMAMANTGLPVFIRQLAEKFVAEIMKDNIFLAMHWRFDPGDWLNHCIMVDYHEICDKIKLVQPIDIINAAVSYISQHKDIMNKSIHKIYLATPLNNVKSIEGAKDEIKRMSAKDKTSLKTELYTSDNLKTFIRKHHNCWENTSFFEDILAMVEKRICIDSTLFMYSIHSSWSANVLGERTGFPHSALDADLLQSVWKQHIER